MGKFSLCVESNLREVNSLLAFHNVHPQVRADVQRRLQRLAYRVYDHIGTLVVSKREPAEDVCAAVVKEFVENTIQKVIPGVELAAEERRSAALQQRTRDLEFELRKSEKQCRELEESLDRFRKAHNFMLRCYFREVLLLRYQLQDAMWRRRRSHSSQAKGGYFGENLKDSTSRGLLAVIPDTKAPKSEYALPTIQASSNLSLSEVVQNNSTSSGSAEVIMDSETQLSTTSDLGRNNAPSLPSTKGASETQTNAVVTVSSLTLIPTGEAHAKRVTPIPAVVTVAGISSLSQPAELPHSSSLVSGVTRTKQAPRKVKANFVTVNAASAREVVPVKTASTQTIPLMSDDSVDAVFDYERYIRQLIRPRRGSALSVEADMNKSLHSKAALEEQRRRKAISFQRMKQKLAQSQENAANASLNPNEKKNESLQAFILRRKKSAAVEGRKTLLEEFNEIYLGVRGLQEQHFKDMVALKKEMDSIESSVALLLGFFGTYAEEVSRLAAALSCEEGAAACTLSGTMKKEDDPYRRRAVMNYFSDAASVGATAVLGAEKTEDEEMKKFMTPEQKEQRKRQIFFWENNPVTLRAKAAFFELQAAAAKLREESSFRNGRKGTMDMLPTVLGFDAFSSALFPDSIRGKSEQEEEEENRALLLLSREEKLKALVQLRMKRISHRARRRTQLRQLADGAKGGKNAEYLQKVLLQASLHEKTVERLTRMINKLLRDLGLSGEDLEAERAFFTKNLASSPYLCESGGNLRDHEENEVVYVPLPVSTRHAGDLCAALSSNPAGYIMFNDEVIPIANVTYGARTGLPVNVEQLRGQRSASAAKAGGRGTRHVLPFHGTVVEYHRGVQLGSPLGDSHEPMYIFWDSNEGSFFLVEEGVDAERTASRGMTPLTAQQGHQQQLGQKRNVHLSTILLSPPLPEPERMRPFVTHSPISPVTSHRAISGIETSPVVTYALERGTPAPSPTPQERQGKLPPCSPPAPSKIRPFRPMILGPNREERDLMRIESLSARRCAGGANKVVSYGTDTALARLKSAQRERQQKTATVLQQTPKNDKTQGRIPNNHFLRMRLPNKSSSLPPVFQ
ncbi:hypothetical protein MOQ_004225 [Trypanosoma cruzi marinkellei]|uniref:Uncharacterized protein n=1 Tax=Trypanosoma cruzi marinkellei TaxID=85056 RepID=K2MXS6_TRYCR|nr:hypothetical protein MOQ_004225 [Trypanosoma cruzi marinkellei]